eukprot:1227446-Amphidinium_carterae.1
MCSVSVAVVGFMTAEPQLVVERPAEELIEHLSCSSQPKTHNTFKSLLVRILPLQQRRRMSNVRNDGTQLSRCHNEVSSLEQRQAKPSATGVVVSSVARCVWS